MKLFLSVLLAGVSIASVAAHAGDAPMPQQPAAFDSNNFSGIYLRGDIGASYLNWGNTSNAWAYVGDAGLGYQFDQNLRADLTYNWSGNYGVSPTGTVSTNLILGNAYYDFRNSTAFTPYVGAGLGYGWEWGNGAATNAQGVAVGLKAGVAYDMTRNLALDVGYRFHDILGANQATPEHQIAAGLRVKF